MIIDTHCHAGGNWFEPVEVLEFQMNRCGVDAAVLIQHGGTYNNQYLFDEAAKRGTRFKVVVLVDPESNDPLGDLTRLAEQGAAGVRIYPGQPFKTAHPHDVWKRAGELGLVVSSLGTAEQFASGVFKDMLDACPETQVVIEHLAGARITEPPYSTFVSALECAERPNTTIKVPGLGEITARPPRLLPEFRFDNVPPLFEMAKDAFGVRRMMWGSDFPPSAGREGYANTLEGVRSHPAFSAGDDIDWVLGKTAAQVWGFEA
ncbi:MAG: amidohydrolase family protein [Chloroflexi bacterium]|nr:amidohydrolase family protein [Chloroflexota bacterium]